MIDSITEVIEHSYGKATSIEDYCWKAQLLQYETNRGMFEAWGRNKYNATGIISWMGNSAWPSLQWQLFDYYLMPGGAYFGTKKACEPLHVQYSYDDDSICVVNSYYQSFENLKVTARIYNLDMAEKYFKSAVINIKPDSSNKAFTIDWPKDLTKTHFLKLELRDGADNLVSSNFYWLSTDDLPVSSDLRDLFEVDLDISYTVEKKGDTYVVYIDFKNPSSGLAFAINPEVKRSVSGDLVLPIYWEDNYLSLLPGEKRRVRVEFRKEDLEGEEPLLVIGGWNIKNEEMVLSIHSLSNSSLVLLNSSGSDERQLSPTRREELYPNFLY